MSWLLSILLCTQVCTVLVGADDLQSWQPSNTRVLLVSSTVRDGDLLADAAADGVVVIRYEARETTLAGLAEQVREALGDRKAASIGLAAHDHGVGRFYLAGTHSICLASTLGDREERRFWRELGGMLAPGGRIDILACNLAATDEGTLLVSALADAVGAEVAASSNPTGNTAAGGDWLLETAGIDAEQIYFASAGLAGFGGLLAAVEQKVVSSDLAAGDFFGVSVSIDGDYAIIGAEQTLPGGTGCAYIFYRSGTVWTQQAKLTASDGASDDAFGASVSRGPHNDVGERHVAT